MTETFLTLLVFFNETKTFRSLETITFNTKPYHLSLVLYSFFSFIFRPYCLIMLLNTTFQPYNLNLVNSFIRSKFNVYE